MMMILPFQYFPLFVSFQTGFLNFDNIILKEIRDCIKLDMTYRLNNNDKWRKEVWVGSVTRLEDKYFEEFDEWAMAEVV